MDITVRKKFASYPESVRPQLMQLRKAIFEVAEDERLGTLSETLKWGEPSYLVQHGSTVRIERPLHKVKER